MQRTLYRLVIGLVGLAVRSGRSKDLEIIVLRHQVTVLRRQVDRPAIKDDDRTLLGAVAQALPRLARDGWIVTPETLLRWHRRRVARHWTYPSRSTGRPPTSEVLQQLIVAMARADLLAYLDAQGIAAIFPTNDGWADTGSEDSQ